MNTEYIHWSPDRGYRREDLRRAAGILRSGGLVAFPTETVYGLGGDGLQKDAAKKIYEAKGRPSDNPLILHISCQSELDTIVKNIPEQAEPLMNEFWPGPMTLIFEKSGSVPYETTGGLDTVAVRMPAHPGARELIAEAGVPVAAPSANTSGRPSPTRAEHVREDLDGRIDMIIQGGSVGIGIESTIIDLTGTMPLILRPGFITREMIARVAGSAQMDPALSGRDPSIRPKAPEMKYRHYAPRAAMTVFEGDIIDVVAEINGRAAAYPADRVGILAAIETENCYRHGHVVAAGSREKGTVANGLYAALRQFDQLGVEVIFSESFSGEEQSEAIMNRLLKAAGHRVEFLPK